MTLQKSPMGAVPDKESESPFMTPGTGQHKMGTIILEVHALQKMSGIIIYFTSTYTPSLGKCCFNSRQFTCSQC